MINEIVSIDETIELLNAAIKLDQKAISTLIFHRIRCNIEIANHPTIQVAQTDKGYEVGLLGIINGLFGIEEKDGWGAIAANVDENGLITEFIRVNIVNH